MVMEKSGCDPRPRSSAPPASGGWSVPSGEALHRVANNTSVLKI